MIKIYHNPRCSKSRSAVSILEEKGIAFEIVKYMDEALTAAELEELLDKLDMDASELLRTNEAIWKSDFADKEMENDELILLMIEHPKLMERPIVVNGNKAVVARPPEKVLEVL